MEVIEVSRLTQIFAENIVSQLTQVDSIHKSAIETNSNLTLGNENIKEVNLFQTKLTITSNINFV